MKKFITLLLIALTVSSSAFVFTACENEEEEIDYYEPAYGTYTYM